GDTVRLPAVLIQPMAADDVAEAVARAATEAPLNATVEVAGPEPFRLDELVRQDLAALNDPRKVITDPKAGYYGTAVDERTLVPGDNALLATTRFEDWIKPSTLSKVA
ncbi:MAG: NmrA family transcriptional regulator, partial [Candidatus Binatia bacterium]